MLIYFYKKEKGEYKMDTKSKEFLQICKDCGLTEREDKEILRQGYAAFSGTVLAPKTKQEEAERVYREKRFWNSLTMSLDNDGLDFDNFMRAIAMCTDITHKQVESSRITAAKVADRENEFATFSNLADSCLRYYEETTGKKYDFDKLKTGIYPEM